uniref:Uncharacterized protein n=1 Tax=viral metagenome TaxID=1070528 RepID=A0A6C0ER07_9ZZZZ
MNKETIVKYTLNIFIVTIVILFIIFCITYKPSITEGIDDTLNINTSDSFCKSHTGSSGTLNESCGKLTKSNCVSTTCCVFLNGDKCVAGTQEGPTYNTDDKGRTKDIDYYYYQNKCYGKKCPK